MSPELSVTSRTLEDPRRLRVEETQAHYLKAQERYLKLLKEHPDGTPHDLNGSIALARQGESEALSEYARVLRAFSALSVDGKLPEEQPAASSEGV